MAEMIDIERALNALDLVVRGRESHSSPTGKYLTEQGMCVVGEALYALGASEDDLRGMGGVMIETLFERGELPLPLTLGAVVTFRAAQRTQDGLNGPDVTWGAALSAAISAGARYIDLMPDAALIAAAPSPSLQQELVTA